MPKLMGLVAGIAVVLAAATTTSARERSELEKAAVKAATDCVAAAALNNSNIVKLHQQDRLKEVTDWIVLKSDACDNPLRAMRVLHDRIYGEGTGRRFLLGDYLSDLPRAVGERIKGEVERRAALQGYAYAPTSPDIPLTKGMELATVNIAPNDVLNIREYATVNSKIVDIIPPNSRGIFYLGESQGDWIFVRYENRAEGWISRKFVQPLTSRGRRL
jgi:hypothetical protein